MKMINLRLPTPPEQLFYHTYLQTLNQTPIIAIDIHDTSPHQPEGLPVYSAAYPLSLYPHLHTDSPISPKAIKELEMVHNTFMEFFELYQSLEFFDSVV